MLIDIGRYSILLRSESKELCILVLLLLICLPYGLSAATYLHINKHVFYHDLSVKGTLGRSISNGWPYGARLSMENHLEYLQDK